jgi:hypothetical protein
MADDGFTPTQRKLMRLLSDGQHHHVSALHACLVDELGDLSNVWAHVTRLRKILRPTGRDIVCESRADGAYYRLLQAA